MKSHVNSVQNVITREKIEKYLLVTKKALDKLKLISPDKTHLNSISLDFLDMAKRYFSDANYFYEGNDYINAFAAINYAHGWLDCGARLGLFDVEHDNVLFTVD